MSGALNPAPQADHIPDLGKMIEAPHPLQQGDEVTREQVARIIAPDAWREYDDEVRDCKLWGEDLNPVPSPDRLSSTRSTLKTADAILALFAPPDLGDLAGLVRDVEALRDTFTIPQADDPRLPWNTLEEAARALRSLAADRDKAVGLLRRSSDDLHAELLARYGDDHAHYPGIRRKFDADMEIVNEARAFLSSQTEEG